jgi:hypothetical protein
MMYLYEQKECTVTAIVAVAARQYGVCWSMRDGGSIRNNVEKPPWPRRYCRSQDLCDSRLHSTVPA